jgi:hypothetical protein
LLRGELIGDAARQQFFVRSKSIAKFHDPAEKDVMGSPVDDVFTVQEAARLLELNDDSTVRRLCIEYEIGAKKGAIRLLTWDDIDKLRKIRIDHPRGRPKGARK